MIYPLTARDSSIHFVHKCYQEGMVSKEEYMRTLKHIAQEVKLEDQSWEVKEYSYMVKTIN